MNMYRFVLLILIIVLHELVYAKCLLQSDGLNCRFEDGDSWCAEHGNGNLYAYSDSCLRSQQLNKSSNQSILNAADAGLAEQEKKLSSYDFSVADITIGMSKINVKKILVKPKGEKRRKGVTRNFTELNYAGLTITLDDGTVFGVEITSPKYATARGLRVGDSVKKLIAIYGKPDIYDDQSLDYNDVEGGLFRVSIEKNKVQWIYVGILDD